MVKLYALRERLEGRRKALSDAVQGALVDAFGLPPDKRAHRFFPLEREDLFAPPDRSDDYVLIELTIMAGRSTEAKKRLVRRLFERLAVEVDIAPQDVEVVILEAPPENWGFRGFHGDEAKLNYSVKV
jgi:phenylpyruvate tautomerase PptA (4-oxalocrotonate tautomerase family)